MALTLRQRKILGALVREFILTAEPVSSGFLERKLENIGSSATIRNEMAELEQLGYLQRPHISAGRIPTNQAYRFYVDYLMDKEELSLEEQYTIKMELNKRIYQIDQLLDSALYLMSHFTDHLSILVPPNLYKVTIKDIRLISINFYSILLVIVTTTGIVINRVIDNSSSIPEEEIEKISNFLKERLEQVTFDNIDQALLNDDNMYNNPFVKVIINEIKISILPEVTKNMKWVGTQHLLSKPEFKDVDKLKSLLDLLENKDFAEFINSPDKKNIKVTIGQEHKFKEMSDCTIITAHYSVSGEIAGNLGIVGPTRMHYGRMVPLISFIADNFTKMLNRIS